MAHAGPAPVLTLRQLNRALLARQLLLKRVRLDPARAIERLGALQAQWPPAPYVALWSRLDRFSVASLERALEERTVVKATVMRGTLHLMSAADYPYYAVASPEARRRNWDTVERSILRYWAGQTPETRRVAANWRGLGDHARLHRCLVRYASTPRSREDLITFLAKQAKLPVELARHFLWSFIAAYGGIINVGGSAKWSNRSAREVVAARSWLGSDAPPTFEAAVAHTVRRYLAAFGPATLADISSWTSIRTPPIGAALAAFGADVRRFRDDRGRLLYDLARAPRPAADTAAPVRFLAKWDSPLLAYSPPERIRIIAEAHRKSVIVKNGDVAQTYLVDGVVAGTWETRLQRGQAVLALTPLGRLARADRAALIEEGERLARFIHPDARDHAVRV
jgi:hypothetical protein